MVVEELLQLLVEEADHLDALGRVHLADLNGLVGELLLAYSNITLGVVVLHVSPVWGNRIQTVFFLVNLPSQYCDLHRVVVSESPCLFLQMTIKRHVKLYKLKLNIRYYVKVLSFFSILFIDDKRFSRGTNAFLLFRANSIYKNYI